MAAKSVVSWRHAMVSVPERPSILSVVDSCPLLTSLSDAHRSELLSECFMAYAERSELIWLAGSPSQFVAVVGVGFVKMCKCSSRGSEVAVELIGPNNCFGVTAALENRPYPLSAIAVTNTWYLKIPVRVFTRLYEQDDQIRTNVVQQMSPRLQRAHNMIARMSSGKVDQRMAAVLLLLMDAYGREVEDGIEVTVPLTRQDLAEMAGTTVETSIRTMSRWQREGIVVTTQQRITILNPDLLNEALLS